MQSVKITLYFASVAECVGVQIEGTFGLFTIASLQLPTQHTSRAGTSCHYFKFWVPCFSYFILQKPYLVVQKSLNAVVRYMMYSQDGFM